MITEIETYFTDGCGRCDRFATPDCATRRWREGLLELRRICRAAGLDETLRWAHPCYRFADRNIAIIGALKGDFRLSFMNPGLMRDPHKVLIKQGPNCQHPGTLKFETTQDVLQLEPIITEYLEELKDYATRGLKAPKTTRDVPMPDELAEALDADPKLAEAFNALTPGRQKSYAFNLNQAKKSQTRIARIEKFRPKILAGKGAQEY